MWKCKEWWNIQLSLRIWCRPFWVSIPCLLQDTNHIYWFYLPNELILLTKKKQRIQISDLTRNKCFGPNTQNPALREVELELSSMRGSDKINMQKQVRDTQRKALYFISSTLYWIPFNISFLQLAISTVDMKCTW